MEDILRAKALGTDYLQPLPHDQPASSDLLLLYRWQAVKEDGDWCERLRKLYAMAPTSTGICAFPWEIRDALGDWLCPRANRHDDLVNLPGPAHVKAMTVIKHVQGCCSSDSSVSRWAMGVAGIEQDNAMLARLFSEIQTKFRREFDVYVAVRNLRDSVRRPDLLEEYQTRDNIAHKTHIESDRLGHLDERLDQIGHEKEYHTRSIVLFSKALIICFVVSIGFFVVASDPAGLLISMAFAVPIGLWGYILARLVPGYRSIEHFMLYCMMANFAYLVYAVLRTVLYKFDSNSFDWVAVLFVWLMWLFAVFLTIFVISIVGVRKIVATLRAFQLMKARKVDSKQR